jgi:hypothetical protein
MQDLRLDELVVVHGGKVGAPRASSPPKRVWRRSGIHRERGALAPRHLPRREAPIGAPQCVNTMVFVKLRSSAAGSMTKDCT